MARPTLLEFIHHLLITDSEADLVADSAEDSLVMPITHPMIDKVTGADGEALTLADGLPGQTLTINLVTAGGGTGTLTPATSTNWATILFIDAGDQAVLFYVDDTIGWIILSVSGLTAQPEVTA